MSLSSYHAKEIKINGEIAIIQKTKGWGWVGYFKKDLVDGKVMSHTAGTKAYLLTKLGYAPKPRKKKVLPSNTELYKTTSEHSKNIKETNDCGVIALAIATGESYIDAHAAFELAGRVRGDGVFIRELRASAVILGYKLTKIENHTIKTINRAEKEFTDIGRFILSTSTHLAAMIDGVVHDWTRGRSHRITRIFKVEKL